MSETGGYPIERQQSQQGQSGNAWGLPISADRQAELQAALDVWSAPDADHAKRDGPFDGIVLSGADVFWLAERVRTPDGGVSELHLERAILTNAQFAGATLRGVHLNHAKLSGSRLEKADLTGAHLTGAEAIFVHLERANLSHAHLDGAKFNAAYLQQAELSDAHLKGTDLEAANLDMARLEEAHLEEAGLVGAHLERSYLIRAHLEGANLLMAHLENANLYGVRFEGATLMQAHLEGANLSTASFDKTSRLNGAALDRACLDQVIFDNTNLSVVDWTTVRTLGDEAGENWETERRELYSRQKMVEQQREAIRHMEQRRLRSSGDALEGPLAKPTVQTSTTGRSGVYHTAARAYRALSVALRAQGIAREATRFHYRAEVMERKALFHEIGERFLSRRILTAPWTFLKWLVSWAIGAFAGYGDYLGRLALTYMVVVVLFAGVMQYAALQDPRNGPISSDSVSDVLVLSVTSFHGRGIQPPGLHLTDLLAQLAGAEAVFGLVIEGLFIATFTRRVSGG